MSDLPRYERDPASVAHVIAKRGAVPMSIDEDVYLIKNCSKVPDHIIEREGFIPFVPFETNGGEDVR